MEMGFEIFKNLQLGALPSIWPQRVSSGSALGVI